MPSAPKQRSALLRRVFMAVLLGMMLLAAGLVALAAQLYVLLDAVLGADPTTSSGWLTLQDFLLAQAKEQWPLAVGVAVAVLLLAWLLAGWALRPFGRLVDAVAALGGPRPRPFPLRAPGEVGLLARRFEELARQAGQAQADRAAQQRLLEVTARRLEGTLRLAEDLGDMRESDQVLRYAALALRRMFDYDQICVAHVTDSALVFYIPPASDGEVILRRAPLSDASLAGAAAIGMRTLRVDDFQVARSAGPSFSMPDALAELAVPAVVDGRAQIVVVAQSRTAQALPQSDEPTIVALARVIGFALLCAQRLSAARARQRLADGLVPLAQALIASMATERLPKIGLEWLAGLLPSQRSALLLVEGQRLIPAALRGAAAFEPLELGGAPLVADVLGRAGALALDDPRSDPRYRPLLGPAAQSWIGVPLLYQGQARGVLVLEHDHPAGYSPEQIALIEVAAGVVATALEGARLYAAAQERARRLEVVANIIQVISAADVSRELPAVLRRIIHMIRRVVPSDFAALALYHEDDDTFLIETVYDFSVRNWAELPAAERIPAAGTPWQTACRTAGPVRLDLLHGGSGFERALEASALRAGVVVPIIGASRTIGALTFASREPDAYGNAQVDTLLDLARYLGPALHNARLAQEREETASKLARTQEYLNLADKLRVIGQLASGVAHDFNNLLAGILGNAQLLLLDVDHDEQREMLKVIEKAARDGAETVRRLQGFARLDHESPLAEVRLDLVARDAIDLTRPRWRDVAQSRGTKIDIRRNITHVRPIAGRAAELREVMTNLIINAVDAMPRGGTITVSTYDELDGAEGSAVVAVVEDQGIGISPEVRTRIFEPFFTTKGEHGSGLGLAVSLGIIQGHGGQIEVESEPGCGARFTIRLPLRQAEIVATKQARREIAVVPGHVLFVESEVMIRDAMVRLLKLWGHRVSAATGGVEALQMFTPDLYDVVISDLGMPDMNGWELLAAIKQLDPRVPTVLLTGWGRQYSDEETRARGVDFVIEKPFNQEDLLVVLAEAMKII